MIQEQQREDNIEDDEYFIDDEDLFGDFVIIPQKVDNNKYNVKEKLVEEQKILNESDS